MLLLFGAVMVTAFTWDTDTLDAPHPADPDAQLEKPKAGDPRQSIEPGRYIVHDYDIRETIVEVLVERKNADGPSEYYSFPKYLVEINDTKPVPTPELRFVEDEERGLSRLTLFIDP